MSDSDYKKDLPNTPEEYLASELHPKLHKMAVNASFSKRMFFTLRAISVVGGLLLPILISISKDSKGIHVLSIIISIAIAVSIALEESFKFKEKYIKLGGIVNNVNKLKGNFIAQENEFANLTEERRITKFASLSSSIILNSQNSLLEILSSLESPSRKT